VFLLALHGGEGEGGVVQGLLEAAGRAYSGAGVAASALCLDKHHTRLVLADAGLAVAPGHLVRPVAWRRDPEAELERLRGLGRAGWFVKPNRGGSSLGVTRVDQPEQLAVAIERVLAAGDAALVEARMLGVEATCGVLGNRGTALRALPPVEIRPRGTAFFDYSEKYSAAGALELCPPEGLGAATVARLQEAALLAHEVTGCDGVSRTDFIVPAEGGPVLALEVNTLPGMTARALVPRSAAVMGLDFPALCLELIRLALEAERDRLA
jgi:D-alanine-D-alanine ligase